VWIIPSADGVTSNVENEFLELLKREGAYAEVFRRETAVCLRRIEKETRNGD
jgi:hypothetical protein